MTSRPNLNAGPGFSLFCFVHRGTESSQTLRWRKADSNSRSRAACERPRRARSLTDLVSVERDCANYSPAALLSDARVRTTKPGFVVGARDVISGFVTVIDRCTVSRSGHPPKRPLGITEIPGRR